MRIKANNWAKTELVENISASADIIRVADVSEFINFPFRGHIDHEYIEVHGKSALDNELTGIIRGLEGTTAAQHFTGAEVACLLTAGVQMEIVNMGFQHKEYAHSGLNFAYYGGDFRNGNDLHVLSDGVIILDDDATNYIYLCVNDNVIKKADTAPDDGSVLLYVVTAANGVIISIEDKRAVLYMGAAGTGVGGGTYTNTNPSVIEVGGILSGTTFDDMSFSEFMDALLYPELFPTLTNPSATFTMSVTGFREIGEDIATLNFSVNFNRGSISPQYQSDSQYRSGLPNEYIYTGTGLTDQAKADLSDAQSINNYVIQDGQQSWTARVAYDEGVQPKGSNGTDFDTPLVAGMTNVITRTITGVYPVFASTVDISVLTKQSLAATDSTIEVEFVAESGGNKQAIAFPDNWGAISEIRQWNPLASTWDAIDLGTFDVSSITEQIQGNTIDYTLYTHNGGSIGSRTLRWAV